MMKSILAICLAASMIAIVLPSPTSKQPEIEVYAVEDRTAEKGDTGYPVGYGLGIGLGALNGITKTLIKRDGDYMAASASTNQRSGYGDSGYGHSGGSLIGSAIGGILGSLLKGLTGVGVKVGLKLNNEFYKVDDYGGGYGGGGYGGGGGSYGGGGHGGGGYGGGGGSYGGGGHGGGGYGGGGRGY